MNKLNLRQRLLLRICIAACVFVLVFGAMYIVDAIQKAIRTSNTTEEISISEDHGEIRAYDVEGMSPEEIEEMLRLQRQNGGNK